MVPVLYFDSKVMKINFFINKKRENKSRKAERF
jgi:hypothetical protein